ncbi:hypothetical protein [Sphingorhabdus buctiana]|jgi:hypothetical protein
MGNLARLDDLFLGLVHLDLSRWLICNLHSATADKRATASAGA